MLRRLRIYFVGFGLGLIVTYMIFSKSEDRNLDIWTPEQRVLEDIRGDRSLLGSERMACYQQCLALNDSLMNVLWTEGSVKSLQPGGDPYVYQIQWQDEEHHLEAVVTWDKKTRQLKSLRDLRQAKDCACDE